MTVSQLIEILKSLPQDLQVVSEGYETGLELIKKIELVNVVKKTDKNWWDGTFEKSNNENDVKVVFLNAETKNERI